MKTFPEEYRDYRQKVPCLLPSITRIAKTDISEYLPLKLPWIKKEISSISAVLFLALFVESLEDVKKKGLTLYFEEVIAYLGVIILFLCLVVYLTGRGTDIRKDDST